MPELPEVETTKQALAAYVEHVKIVHVQVRQTQLRQRVADNLAALIEQQIIGQLTRRAKYLIMPLERHYLLWHLGMSGSLRLMSPTAPLLKHDHLVIDLANHWQLRYHDPRRFGSVALFEQYSELSQNLRLLGPEPLSRDFNADYIYRQTRTRRQPIKSWLMNGRQVVGIGNIYAAEALFLAHIHPNRIASELTLAECQALSKIIKTVLRRAIKQGGSTIRDFVSGINQPGYFTQELNVYGRGGQSCYRCQTLLEKTIINQRTTIYCPTCQH